LSIRTVSCGSKAGRSSLSFLSGFGSAILRISRPVTVLLALGAGQAALADAVFVYEGEQFSQDAQIIVREGKVVVSDVDESSLSLIYDTRQRMFQVLNHKEKTYLELSGEFVQTLLAGMAALAPQLQAMSENSNISERQRELLADITTKLDSSKGAEQDVISVDARSSNRNVLGLTCEEYAVSFQASAYDVCAIGYGAIGLSDGDKDSLRELSTMLKGFSSTVQFHEAQALATVLGHLDGVILEALDDKGEPIMRLKQLTLAARSSSDGEVPSSYRETDLFSIFSGL